ncbi:MAG: HAD family hydrolase [Flavobacteriaceae bacterium]
MMQVFFDFDGTLIDSRKRLYELFKHLVPESHFTFDEYWELKRAGIGHSEILKKKWGYTQGQIIQFTNNWMRLIEEEDWIKYDVPIDGVTEYLEFLSNKNIELYLITNRQKKEILIDQIKHLEWERFFKKILVTEQKITKSDCIKPYIINNNNCFLIADTGQDIKEGNSLGIHTVAVSSGFLSKEKLEQYNPESIIDDVTKFII